MEAGDADAGRQQTTPSPGFVRNSIPTATQGPRPSDYERGLSAYPILVSAPLRTPPMHMRRHAIIDNGVAPYPPTWGCRE